MKTLAVSDIHGLYDELVSALCAAGCLQGDRLIFLGDYTNAFTRDCEGSLKVLDFPADLQSLSEQHVFIRGNHEDMLLSAFMTDTEEMIPGIMEMYGRAFLDRLTERQMSLLGGTVKRHDEMSFVFVHDGSVVRSKAGRVIVSGHYHYPEPIVGRGRIVMASDQVVFVLDTKTMAVFGSDGRMYDASGAKEI